MTKKEALRLVDSLRNGEYEGLYIDARRVFADDDSPLRGAEDFFPVSAPDVTYGMASNLESLAYSYNGDIA